MYPVLAKVTFWDEIDNKTKKAVHILNAYNLADAAKQLEDYYGEDNVNKVHLIIYESGLPTFPVEMYEPLQKMLGGKEE